MRILNASMIALAACSTGLANGQSVFFSFDDAPIHTSLPIDYTVDGLTAHLSATGQGFSIQRADALGFTPQGFSGLCVYPNSVFAADLLMSFSAPLTDISMMYAPEEYGCDSSARMKISAYLGNTFIGSSTTTAPNAGTWPTGVLGYSNASQAFDRVVVHYDAPPPTGGDWGPIFMVDNMSVQAVPEPAGFVALFAGLGALTLFRRR